MIQAKTEEQKSHIKLLLKEHGDGDILCGGDGITFRVDSCFDVVIDFETMAEIVDYLRTSDKKDELFEECWKAYRRKGSKKQSKAQWIKLTGVEKQSVMPHIKAYVSSREITFQKDFERYLRDRIFNEVIYNRNGQMVFDPQMVDSNAYVPQQSPMLNWNDYYKCYMYVGYWDGHISDGYSDDDRPDGASVTLNNGRGTIVWDKETKKWVKK